MRVWSGAIEVASFWACTGAALGLEVAAVSSVSKESVGCNFRDDSQFAAILIYVVSVLQPDSDIHPEVAKHLCCYYVPLSTLKLILTVP